MMHVIAQIGKQGRKPGAKRLRDRFPQLSHQELVMPLQLESEMRRQAQVKRQSNEKRIR